MKLGIWEILIGLFGFLTAIGLIVGLIFQDYTFGVLSFVFMIIILFFSQKLKQPLKSETDFKEKQELI